MATRFIRLSQGYLSATTTRYVTVNSSLATQVIMNTGYSALRLFNQGSTPLIWGDSTIAINSGNYLYPSASIEWNPVQDNFSFYIISDSTGTIGIAEITEYRQ